ncbi:MAG: DegT/DnrJ/EryC1/StrS family aminotransferase [Rhodobacteraceae bacterium]|nr:DegT/DnrJ/EryC1/StrS family aminotransferase [Paracoccaceae bacterium]
MTSSRAVTFIDLEKKYSRFSEKLHDDLDRVLSSGFFILGNEVKQFETSVKAFTGAKHAVAVANGTDALVLSLKAAGIKPGDEVITTPMTYLATASSIALVGAIPVFIDVDASLNLDPDLIEDAITDRTRAISVVHLAGVPAQAERIAEIATKRGLVFIEDCAQSLGATRNGKMTGTFGDFGTLSFHPLKNLGTLGDGGMILVSNQDNGQWLGQARNHGHAGRDDCDFWSINSRLDELHAAFLSSMLPRYAEELDCRRQLAQIYREELAGTVQFPLISQENNASYNWVMLLVERRDELIEYLAGHGIEVKVHYPKLIPELKAAQNGCRIHGDLSNAKHMVKRILSVPMAEHITVEDVRYVCQHIKTFYR